VLKDSPGPGGHRHINAPFPPLIESTCRAPAISLATIGLNALSPLQTLSFCAYNKEISFSIAKTAYNPLHSWIPMRAPPAHIDLNVRPYYIVLCIFPSDLSGDFYFFYGNLQKQHIFLVLNQLWTVWPSAATNYRIHVYSYFKPKRLYLNLFVMLVAAAFHDFHRCRKSATGQSVGIQMYPNPKRARSAFAVRCTFFRVSSQKLSQIESNKAWIWRLENIISISIRRQAFPDLVVLLRWGKVVLRNFAKKKITADKSDGNMQRTIYSGI